jgi:hypothetical protein
MIKIKFHNIIAIFTEIEIVTWTAKKLLPGLQRDCYLDYTEIVIQTTNKLLSRL